MSRSGKFPRHYAARRSIAAPPAAVFAYLDDHRRLSKHMSQSSWMMLGSRMSIELDAAQGQLVGSRIQMSGRVLGLQLYLSEVVTIREPPWRKAWQTDETPRLLIIGHYRMGFEIAPVEGASVLRVFIDYDYSGDDVGSWLGFMLGDFYARWCTNQMADDAAHHFTSEAAAA